MGISHTISAIMWNKLGVNTVNNILNSSKYVLQSQVRKKSFHPAIPSVKVNAKFSKKVTDTKESIIDSTTIEHLEGISLVDFANVRGIERLEEAVKLADVIRTVDTSGVEPMYSVLEEETLFTRQDIPEPQNCRKQLMETASVTEEEYFVAPQGNVPLSNQKTYDRDT